MRNIKDIISELKEHPDFLNGEIYTKQDILNYFDDMLEEAPDDIRSDISYVLFNLTRSYITEHLEMFFMNSYNSDNSPFPNIKDVIEYAKKRNPGPLDSLV